MKQWLKVSELEGAGLGLDPWAISMAKITFTQELLLNGEKTQRSRNSPFKSCYLGNSL